MDRNLENLRIICLKIIQIPTLSSSILPKITK